MVVPSTYTYVITQFPLHCFNTVTQWNQFLNNFIYVTRDLVDNNNIALLVVWFALRGGEKSDRSEAGS